MERSWKTLFLLTFFCTFGLMTSAKAQITPDNSLGAETSTVGQPNQTINGIPINQIDQINGGARRGGNLFHSFGEFNVNAGRAAYFTNPDGVGNILTRVTGVNRSNILGTLGVLGNANLFLINPNGIFFGPNSSLDVRGSFLGSSANSLLFDNGFEFSATNAIAPPLLTVNIPIGLRFRDNPGNITNESLESFFPPQVEPGNTLALIGGDVNFNGGSLTALGVNVEIGGLKAPGTVGINNDGSLSFPDGVTRGDISFSNGASVDVRFIDGGNITVNGRNVEVSGGSVLNAGIFPGFGMSEAQAGDIVINATDKLTITGTPNFASVIANTVGREGTGNAGNIKFNTNNLILSNAQIDSSTSGNGNAGNISLQVGDAIAFTDSSIITANVQQGGSGKGGDIDIRGRSLTVTGGSQIQAGLFAETNGLRGGNGTGGSIKINASDFVDISGFNFVSGLQSGIFTPAETGSTGPGGSIDITTGAFRLANFGVVTARTDNGNNGGDITINAKTFEATNGLVQTALFGRSEADGLFKAGNIQLNVSESVTLKDGSQINSSTYGQGNAGNVTLRAENGDISLTGGSFIFSTVESGGTGNAGKIDVTTRNLSLTDGSELQTLVRAGQRGNAGNITVQASGNVSFSGLTNIDPAGNSGLFPSGIFNEVQSGASGNAGNIIINAASIFLDNDALLRTTNASDGFAGDIALNARDQVSLKQSTIESNGNRGRIFIGKNDIYGDGTSSPRVVRLEGSSLSTTNDSITGADDTSFNAGNISIDAIDSISLNNRSFIQALTRRRGNAGDVTLRAENGDISLAGGSFIFSTVESGGTGNAGKIDVTTRNLSLSDGSELQTLVRAGQRGNAGNITVQASGNVSFSGFTNIDLAGNSGVFPSGVISLIDVGATGSGGDIKITAKNLFLTNSARIIASTFGNGNAGNVTINASDRVSFAGFNNDFFSGAFSTVENGAVGKGGNINISARSLSLSDGALLNTATLTQAGNTVRSDAGNIQVNVSDDVSMSSGGQLRSDTFGQGNAGNITLEGRNGTLPVITLDGVGLINNVQRASGIASSVGNDPQSGLIGNGKGGDITIRARSLSVTNGGVIDASTFAQGNAGNVTINASDRVSFAGFGSNAFSSGVYSLVASGAVGNGGNINISTGSLSLSDGAVVNALTSNSGDAGNITINAKTFTASGGGQVITTTRSSGSAGNINLNIRDRITISGSDPNYNQRLEQAAQFGSPDDIVDNQGAASGIFANTAPGSTGNGGSITIQQEQNSFPTIAIADGGEVTVDSQGRGRGGEISITGNTLTLDRGIINASTASANGGNINLNLRNFIRLRNESLISANARGQQSGNGGNITINTPFIVAFPQNNDIIANAVSGDGGRVTINRSAILFGIAPLRRADLQRLLGDNNLDPRRLPTSDITAFSEQNLNFGDNVQVTSPDVDPSRGLVELPETVSDRTQQIAQNPCQQGIGNEFVVTGRGGLPTTPNQTLNSDNVRVDLLQPVASSGNSRSATIKPATIPTARRVPAQGWIFNDKGQVVLTAYDPTNTGSQRPFSTAAACPAR